VAIPNKVHQSGPEDSCGFGAWRITPNATDVIVKACNSSDFFFAENSPHEKVAACRSDRLTAIPITAAHRKFEPNGCLPNLAEPDLMLACGQVRFAIR
jgi:hypothetical protein